MATNKKKSKKVVSKRKSFQRDSFALKFIIFCGVIVLATGILRICNYYFVKNSDIKVNYSTDKKLEHIILEGTDELIPTQKYISDLEYSMRYDTEKFKVFKYKKQDFFRFNNNESMLVIIEKSEIPSSCSKSSLGIEYDSCYVFVDKLTEEYYIHDNDVSYKVTIKVPNTTEYNEGVRQRIVYMLNTFKIIKK